MRTTGAVIKALRENSGMKATELATRLGITQSYVSLLEQGKRKLSPDLAKKLAEIFSVKWEVFFSDAAQSDLPFPEQPSNVKSMNDAIMVPVISDDVKACCGSGLYAYDIEWNIEGHYPMDASDLMGYSWQTSQFFIIRAQGNSMTPLIDDGDRVLFASEIEVSTGDICVAKLDGKLYVRGFIDRGDEISLHPTNKDYEDIVVRKDYDDFGIVGKVLGLAPAYQKLTGFR